MLEDHYSFSRTVIRILSGALLATSLAACSTTVGQKPVAALSYAAPKPARAAHNSVDEEAPASVVVNKRVRQLDFGKTGSVATVSATDNANCRYLVQSAKAEAAIIGSPTLEANSDEEGAGSVSLTMNLFDFNKAELVRSSAQAKCQYQLASKQIDATLTHAGKSTIAARNAAKYSYLQSRLGSMEKIGRSARQKMQNGAMTRQHANTIQTTIGQLKAEMQLANAEAKKARDMPEPDMSELQDRYTDLLLADRQLQEIERDIRTNDALELSIGGGYRYNETSTGITSSRQEDDAFAKVTLGIKLGALAPVRAHAEQAAALAREDALFEKYSGTIWKGEYTRHSIGRLITDLEKTEIELVTALGKTADSIAALTGGDSAEAEFMLMKAQLQKISISARLAELRAAIGQLRKNKARISAFSGNKK